MARRRKDKFLQEMHSINSDRSRRKAHRRQQSMNGFVDPWAGLNDGIEFRTREFKALGKDVGRGVVREFGTIGKGTLVEGTNLAVDFITSLATLGMAPATTSIRRSARRKRRRRR